MKSWCRKALILAAGGIPSLLGIMRGHRFICLHDVADRGLFKAGMEWLARSRQMAAVGTILSSPASPPKTALTFDDGDATWVDHVVPVLESLHLPALFFVCSGLVGLSGSTARDFIQKKQRRQAELIPVTRTQLRDLAAHPLFEVGGHTVDHVDMGAEQNALVLRKQVVEDKKNLEEMTGTRLRFFAYPFGMPRNITSSAQRIVNEAEYEAAFSLIPGGFTSATNKYLIGRHGLDLQAPHSVWGAELAGGYDRAYGWLHGTQIDQEPQKG